MTALEEHTEDPEPDDDEMLAAEIATLRLPLQAYAFSLLANHSAGDDVAQETCLYLWEHRAERRSGSDLKGWAFSVARFKALAWRRDKARERTVNFSEDVLHRIDADAQTICNNLQERLDALQTCLTHLAPQEIHLLRLKYVERTSLTAEAHRLGHHPNRLQKAISRLRLALRHCIESKLTRQP